MVYSWSNTLQYLIKSAPVNLLQINGWITALYKFILSLINISKTISAGLFRKIYTAKTDTCLISGQWFVELWAAASDFWRIAVISSVCSSNRKKNSYRTQKYVKSSDKNLIQGEPPTGKTWIMVDYCDALGIV